MAHTYASLDPSTSSSPSASTRPVQPSRFSRPSQTSRPSRLHPVSRRIARCGGLAAFVACLSLIILSLISYLSPLRGATRPCLPFSLHRLSTSAHSALACPDSIGGKMATTSGPSGSYATETADGEDVQRGQLEGWLRAQKDAFFGDLSKGSLNGWTVVMGNEAGDLDSLSASIAFAYLSTKLRSARTIPITLTPSTLMHLRPENMLALKLSGGLNKSALVYPDTLPLPDGQAATPGVFPSTLSFLGDLGAKYALVDHNRLLPLFGDGEVDAIIDHHEDEHAHLDASLRMIQVPTGSCSSLVAKAFENGWSTATTPAETSPEILSEVATLLLSAILIDTGGLKTGGKATPTDTDAAAFLYPISRLPATASITDADATAVYPEVFDQLSTAKSDVSGLTTRELLLRDYKEYVLPTSSVSYPSLKAGLSTVPVGIKVWLEREPDSWHSYMAAVDAYMVERKLDLQGILTSFSSAKSGKHKRELLLVSRAGFTFETKEEAKKAMKDLIVGFEGSSELSLAEWVGPVKKMLMPRMALDDESGGRFGKVWKQENKKATRKQVAPLLRELVLKLQ